MKVRRQSSAAEYAWERMKQVEEMLSDLKLQHIEDLFDYTADCVCGHPSEHHLDGDGSCGGHVRGRVCKCTEFQPCSP